MFNANLNYKYFQNNRIRLGTGFNLRKNFIKNTILYCPQPGRILGLPRYENNKSVNPEIINFIDFRIKKIIFRTNMYYGVRFDSFSRTFTSHWFLELEIGKLYH